MGKKVKENIYKSPDSDVDSHLPVKGSLIKGVLWGALTDVGGTLLFGVLFGSAYGIVLATQGRNEQEIMTSLTSIDHYSPASIFSSLIGLLISFYAGFLCAKKAGKSAAKAAVILAVISCSFGLALGYQSYSFIEITVLSLLTTGAIYLGFRRWNKVSA